MGVKIFRTAAMAGFVLATIALLRSEITAAQTPSTLDQTQTDGQGQNQGQGRRRGMGGMGGFPGGGRGVLGTVTEATADHYTIKTDNGEIYSVHFSPNTHIMKQAPGRGQSAGGGNGQANGRRNSNDGQEGDRPIPQTIKPTDIHVGDIITAGGEMDVAGKSVGAVFIALVDPERAKQMREMQANYGKTWLAGRITGIHETTITIEGMVDHAPHSIVVDENTSFRQRRDAITLGDIQPGEQMRAEGAVKGGVFLATTITAMQPQNREGGPASGTGAGPGGAPGPQ